MKNIKLKIVEDEMGLGVLINTEEEFMEYKKGMKTKYKNVENVCFSEELLIKHGMRL